MSRFDHYFQMNVGDVIEYTLEKATEIPWDRDSMEAVVPPSHGNLNYVYRVWDGKGHSIYIKQAGSEARISKDIKPSGAMVMVAAIPNTVFMAIALRIFTMLLVDIKEFPL